MSKDIIHVEEGLEKMEVVGNHNGFDASMEEDDEQDVMVMGVDKEIWLDREQENMLDDVVNEASIFYDEFPPLPDFPCMSSSSSSSSLPAPTKPISATSSSASSSAASWVVLKPDAEEDTEKKIHNFHQRYHQVVDQIMDVPAPPGAQSSTESMEAFPASEDGTGALDCIDVMENLAYMDQLIDSNDIWDPSSIFERDQTPQDYEEQRQKMSVEGLQRREQKQEFNEEDNNGGLFFFQDSELAVIFFEWLKQNKDYISAEDMRSIKLKRSTVESASKQLGSTKEGKKQLLKLILEWVEQYQLQKKRMREAAAIGNHHQFQEPIQNPNPNPNPNPNNNLNRSSVPAPPDPNAYFSPSPWMAPPPVYVPEWSPMVAQPAVFPPGMGYMGDHYSYGASVPPLSQPVNGNPYLPFPEFQVMEFSESWQPSHLPMPSQYVPFPDNSGPSSAAPPPPQSTYGSQYPYQIFDGTGERLMRLGPSATKEARKKRMARQRRLSTHHYRHQTPTNQNQNQAQSNDLHATISGANCTSSPASPGSWVYWPSTSAAPASAIAAMVPSMDAPQPIPMERPPVQPQNYQRPGSSARRQGWKTEKNLRFLLQKVLKQSDVGNLGRIVLPKKEAEIHLPELDSRDGIPIAMEDIGTSRVWNMRYRFWPNNKSRMYLLENTGEFVRANGLQEGDFIVLYSDIKCGKYLIRGVKVRQSGPKSEGKKHARRSLRNIAPAINTSSLLAPIKQPVK